MQRPMSQSDKEERSVLIKKLKEFGIIAGPNSSLAQLRERYNKELEAQQTEPEEKDTGIVSGTDFFGPMWDNSTRLIRVEIRNRNPEKLNLNGEIFTVGNEFFDVTKYVPYKLNKPYHIPFILYMYLLNKKFFAKHTEEDPQHKGITRVRTVEEREFDIKVLDPLTPEEIKELAAVQQARKNMN